MDLNDPPGSPSYSNPDYHVVCAYSETYAGLSALYMLLDVILADLGGAGFQV